MVADSRSLGALEAASIDLIVTSPPYPMIEMWDDLFASLKPEVRALLESREEDAAIRSYELMHLQLDRVWRESSRLLRDGGILCVNIGDATRTIGDRFQLYPNHSRVIAACLASGFECLPLILWRKQTNAPNKFMGSGMYPPGAYVTLEHEYILIFRKGGRRRFERDGDKEVRRRSAYFWEERNTWFSDLWDFKGTRQSFDGAARRERSGAFPLELAFRLVSMFSVYGDTVLDPFAGTGTTSMAALLAGRDSIGVELDEELTRTALDRLTRSAGLLRGLQSARVERHLRFAEERRQNGTPCGYLNSEHGFPVMTRQEIEMRIDLVRSIVPTPGDALGVTAEYAPLGELSPDA